MKNLLNVILILFLLFFGCISKKVSDQSTSSLVGMCEKNIDLFGLKAKWTFEKNRAYTNFEYIDQYPSKRALNYLEKKLIKCGWTNYKGKSKFYGDSDDWVQMLSIQPNKKNIVIYQFGKCYLDKSQKRISVILIQYRSKILNTEDSTLYQPNNNKQYITLQLMNYSENDEEKAINQYYKSLDKITKE